MHFFMNWQDNKLMSVSLHEIMYKNKLCKSNVLKDCFILNISAFTIDFNCYSKFYPYTYSLHSIASTLLYKDQCTSCQENLVSLLVLFDCQSLGYQCR